MTSAPLSQDELDLPVPLWPADVTAPFLTAALRASGAVTGARVEELTSTLVGTGQMGTSVRFTLRWDKEEPHAPASVIGKFASDSPDVRKFMAGFGYRREVDFYRKYAARSRARVPVCHVAELDSTDGAFLLLLEDLSPSRPGDQIAGLDESGARAAVLEMARLHASFWDDPDLAGSSIFARNGGDAEGSGAMLADAIPGFLDRVGAALTPQQRGFFEQVASGATTWLAHHRAAAHTLAHNDFRPDNLMFGTGAGDNGDGPTVAVLDWQGASWGAGADDLAFLIGTSLEPELRRSCERGLIEAYHEELQRHGVGDGNADEVFEGYRRGPVSGLFTTVFGAAFGAPTERGDLMFCAMARRTAQQAIDLDCAEFFTA